ncbi:MAG: Penicillin-binding protein 2D [Syntrophus sp. PtaU1.Bin208]|nr:MAG: Penicillin-binding protein 2D [Syntrophus sp. PtaU1.Bin208]
MVKRILFLALAAMFLGIVISTGLYFFYPNVNKLKKENPSKTAFMEFREQEWRDEGKDISINQKWVRLSRISPLVIKAVIISEDDKFWRHEGFDYEALQKAFEEDIKKRRLQVGGSTISQQLAKNLYLSPSKNPIRKIKEAILTWRIEKALSKKRIIELYLNVAEWGEGIFGIEAASRKYYGKPASALSAQEAATLAAVLPNPRRYNPLGSSKYVRNRSERIYRIMVRRGIVIPDYEAVMKEPEEASPSEAVATEPSPVLPPVPDKEIEVQKKPEFEEKKNSAEGKEEPSQTAGSAEKPETPALKQNP